MDIGLPGTPSSPQMPKPEVFIPHDQGRFPKTLIIVLVAVVLIIILGSAGFYFLNLKKSQNTLPLPNPAQTIVTLSPTPLPTESLPSPTPTPDPTYGWQLFTYPILSLKLPPEWKEVGKKNPILLTNTTATQSANKLFDPLKDAGKLKLEIFTDNSSLSVATYAAKKKPTVPTPIPNATSSASVSTNSATTSQGATTITETPITVDDQLAIQVKTTSPGFTVYVKDPQKPVIVTLVFGYDFDNFQTLAEQILATVKFADNQKAADTTTWKTYTDTQTHYTIKFPNNLYISADTTNPSNDTILSEMINPIHGPTQEYEIISVSVHGNPNNYSANDYLTKVVLKQTVQSTISSSPFTLDTEKGIRASIVTGQSNYDAVFVQKNSFIYDIRLLTSGAKTDWVIIGVDKFNQILSTFKFTQ